VRKAYGFPPQALCLFILYFPLPGKAEPFRTALRHSR